MKLSLRILIFIALLAAAYLAGPRPDHLDLDANLPEVPEIDQIDSFLAQKEAAFNLRPNNEARIDWYGDSIHQSEWVLLYIHGFSASHQEGAPVNTQIAQYMKANLVLARLKGHGYMEESLRDYTAEAGWEDCKEALAIAKKLGKKVAIMSTSTGGSYALNLAATFPESVDLLINLSPNIRVKDPAAALLNDPWGLQIAKIVLGEKRRIYPVEEGHALYWDTLYTVNAVVELQNLLESSLNEETFAKVNTTCLNLCYYKNEEEQDPVVSVDAIRWMHEHLGTPEDSKFLVELPTVGNHVLANPIKSKDPAAVEQEIKKFLDRYLD